MFPYFSHRIRTCRDIFCGMLSSMHRQFRAKKKPNQITEGSRPKSIAILAVCITYICICKCIYKDMYINNHIKSNIIDTYTTYQNNNIYNSHRHTHIYIYTYSILIIFWLCQGLKTRAAYCYSWCWTFTIGTVESSGLHGRCCGTRILPGTTSWHRSRQREVGGALVLVIKCETYLLTFHSRS